MADESAAPAEAAALTAPRHRSLSPSRAGDFLTCPLLYRFRVIDRLPEPPSPAAARGTLVHAVLEHLFDRPAAERTPEAARSLLDPEWERLLAAEPELAGLFPADAERAGVAGRGGYHAGPLLHPGGSPAAGAGPPGAVRGGRAGLRPAAARLHRPAGRGARRRDPDRGLQDRDRAARRVRGARAVPDEVLRAGAVAGRGPPAPAAPADVPGQRRDRPLPARRGRSAGHRAQGGGTVAGHRAGPDRAGLAAPARAAVRLVRAQAHLPGLRRDSPAAARGGTAGWRPAAAVPA